MHAQAGLQNPDTPYSSIHYASKGFPSFTPQSSMVCNADLPSSTTVDRYIYVIEHYISQVPSTPVMPIPEDTWDAGTFLGATWSMINIQRKEPRPV